MEADAKGIGCLPCRQQQRGCIAQADTEFRRETDLRMPRRYAQPDAQRQIGSGHAVGHGRSDDFRQFLMAVEREDAHAMPVIGLGDRFGCFDGMHERERGFGQQFAHQPHLGDGCDIELADTAGPQQADQVRARVCFHGIEALAGKMQREEARCLQRGFRTDKGDGGCGLQLLRYPQRGMALIQFKGPPQGS
jgi:hypothetical protein